jgi:hypothetical protein
MKNIFILIGIILLGINVSTAQNSCANADFSSGDFTNWTGSTGDAMSGGDYTNVIQGLVIGTPNSLPSDIGQQTLMTLAGTDPNTGNGLSVLPPNGTNSVRLGNDLCSGCVGGNPQAARLQYTYQVTSSNYQFSYQYAFVLQDPGTTHTNGEKPQLNISWLNNGSLIDSVNLIAGSVAGTNTCAPASSVCSTTENVVWKDWTTETIDLSAYMGTTVTIQFTTFDCTLGGHFGYAYLSCYCGGNMELTQECMGDSVVVSAPIGFSDYLWNTGDTTVSIVVHNPLAGDSVSCTCSSPSDTVILSAAVSTIPVTGLTANSDTICKGDDAVLTASGTYSYVWSNGSTGATITVSPATTTQYTVTATSSGGCSSKYTTSVTVNWIQLTTGYTDEHCGLHDGAALVTASGGSGPYSYTWGTVPPTYQDSLNGQAAGIYTVTVTDGNCTSTATVQILNLAGPTAQITDETDETCGLSDGAATVYVSGGTSPYQYSWNSNPAQYTNYLHNVPAGTYGVTATDIYGCSCNTGVNIWTIPLSAPEICLVTNDTATNHNLIVWEKPPQGTIDKYYIYRESAVAGVYDQIGVQDYSAYSSYLDTAVLATQQSYSYKISILDTCSTMSAESDYHKTIHLIASAGVGSNSCNLIWNAYQGTFFSTYIIYRGSNPGNMTFLTSVSSSVTSYSDLTPPIGNVYYMIEVLPASPCNPTKNVNSISAIHSNISSTFISSIAEIFSEDQVQLMPNPSNGIFTIYYNGKSQMNFEIINPLGQQIMKDILSGGPKTIDLSDVPKGEYFLKIISGKKTILKKIIIK